MISYRQANHNDFEFAFNIKINATKRLIEKIWGWDNDVQFEFHKNSFNPSRTKIIIYKNKAVGYISSSVIDKVLFIENILLDTHFQGKGIGTRVLNDTIKITIEKNQSIELQVFKINERAKKLYERLNFQTYGQTELHYKMRYVKK